MTATVMAGPHRDAEAQVLAVRATDKTLRRVSLMPEAPLLYTGKVSLPYHIGARFGCRAPPPLTKATSVHGSSPYYFLLPQLQRTEMKQGAASALASF